MWEKRARELVWVKNIGRCWKKESEAEEEREKESETVGESE